MKASNLNAIAEKMKAEKLEAEKLETEFGIPGGDKEADKNISFSDELKKSLVKSLSFFGISREVVQNAIVESDMIELGISATSEIVKDFCKRVNEIQVDNRLKRYSAYLDTIKESLQNVSVTPIHVFLDVTAKEFFAMSKAVRQKKVKSIIGKSESWKVDYLKEREKVITEKINNCITLRNINGEVILKGLSS